MPVPIATDDDIPWPRACMRNLRVNFFWNIVDGIGVAVQGLWAMTGGYWFFLSTKTYSFTE